MNWLSQNWIWLLFALAFVAMHLFGHGSHGGHEGGVHYEDKDAALILPDPNVVFPYSEAAQQAVLIQR
jgi:hypothetical protein